ncbi:hypothetical protein SLEP1_g22842 [Rubroshorea leprosula]|uniref:Uncharacterized protein n=1 Tax=Rubroshorea leprosula TaxID=152421 RepID=A0AAV5JJP9_9ROSI|nr:hypothetical protein SLEP1_g22842 [Rubroshorea leprosula]
MSTLAGFLSFAAEPLGSPLLKTDGAGLFLANPDLGSFNPHVHSGWVSEFCCLSSQVLWSAAPCSFTQIYRAAHWNFEIWPPLPSNMRWDLAHCRLGQRASH